MENNLKAKINETKKAQKDLDKAPNTIIRAYEIWARLVEEHGSHILRNFPGYHDEKLSGNWKGYRSSRLDRKWRVIYRQTEKKEIEILEVNRVSAHDYRRKS